LSSYLATLAPRQRQPLFAPIEATLNWRISGRSGNILEAIKKEHVLSGQGDQIGRTCANWALVCFGQLFDNNRSSLNFLGLLFSTE
jgi:hypothetical protein